MRLAAIRNLTRVLERDEARFVAVRYACVALAAAEALVFARLLGPSGYGPYALVQQIALLLALAAIGHPAGYVFSFFRIRSQTLDRYYVPCALVQYLGGVAAACLIGIWHSLFFAAAAYYLIQIPYLLFEPVLRVRGRYTLSGAARGFGSLGVLLTALPVAIFGTSALTPAQGIGILLAGTTAGYLAYYLWLLESGAIELDRAGLLAVLRNREDWRLFWKNVLRPGIPLNASSALLTTQNNLPRFFLEHFHPAAALGVFSLAWQLSQGAMVMLSSLNAVAAVEIGKLIESGQNRLKAELRRQFLRAARTGVVAFCLMVAAAFVLHEWIYPDYRDLVLITVLLNAGYLALNITGSVTGFLFYNRRTGILNGGYAAAVILSSAASWAIGKAGLWYGYQVMAVSAILVLLNGVFLLSIYRTINRAPQTDTSAAGEPALAAQ